MNAKMAVVGLLLIPVAACGHGATADPTAKRPPATAAKSEVAAVQPSVFADHALIRAAVVERHRAEHRAAVRAERLAEQRRRTAFQRRMRDLAAQCGAVPQVHFDTPDAAMTYMAAAWNRRDTPALCAVSAPDARADLMGMHDEAVNLRFVSCDKVSVGYFACHFAHDYPAHLHQKGHGEAEFIVAAATKPGWYMASFGGCG